MTGTTARVLVIAAGCVLARTAQAQDPFAPIRCFAAANATGLESLKAKQLCVGAGNEAPAQCYEAATTQLALVDTEAVRLCQIASSTEPAACAAQLSAQTALDDRDIVTYCAALQWPLIANPSAGAPVCIEAAEAQTLLTELEAVRLCQGSSSTAPVECFLAGDAELLLSDSDLVDLCIQVVAAPLYPGSPYSGY